MLIEETSRRSVRSTRQSKSYGETEDVTGLDHIEIHEDIEDAEPTFYNERKVHLQLNESPSLSRTKDDETDTTTLDNQRKGRL